MPELPNFSDPAMPGVTIDAVEWLPSGADRGLLRVRGRWAEGTAPAGAAPDLVVHAAAAEHRFEALPDARPDRDPVAWRASYLVPAELLAVEPAAMWVAWDGGARTGLPSLTVAADRVATEPGRPAAAAVAPAPPAPAPGGQVIDQAVLAERRARRAEAAEQAQARIAAEAREAAETLEARVADMERRLEAAGAAEAARVAAFEELESAVASARAELAAARAEAEAAAEALRARVAAAEAAAAQSAGDLSAAHDAARLTDARLHAESVARAALEDELDRERAVRATLASDLVAALRGGETAEAGVRSLREELEAERAARRAAEAELEAARTERAEAERAGQSLAERIADLERRAAAANDPARLERLAREQTAATESVRAYAAPVPGATDLAARLDAAAAALRDRAPELEPELAEAEAEPEPQPAAEPEPAAEPAPPAAATPAAPEPAEAAAAEPPARPAIVSAASPPPRADVLGTSRRDYPLLRGALVKLAHDDPAAAGRILVALLPAQAAVIEGPLAYDVTIREVGTFGVTVAGGSASAERLERPRSRREAAFHLRADALTLAELLAGVDHRIGRFSGRVRISGRRRRSKPLRALPQAKLTLIDAARAGATLEPALAWPALAYAVHPAWTAGQSFTVAHELTEGEPQRWYMTARDGGGMAVSTADPADLTTATVSTSRAAFDRLLRDEPQPAEDRPWIRGDHAAVAALLALIDRARR